MDIAETATESWGQPPICVYRMDSDGENLYVTELDDRYGQLVLSGYGGSHIAPLTSEDLEDIALFEQTVNQPTVAWTDLKQELAKDGLL